MEIYKDGIKIQEELRIAPIKIKKGRVPRKLKKQWKKNPYFKLYGWLWISHYKWNNYSKEMFKYWGIKHNFASVRDTGESIQGTYQGLNR